jgi:hypothetical protein
MRILSTDEVRALTRRILSSSEGLTIDLHLGDQRHPFFKMPVSKASAAGIPGCHLRRRFSLASTQREADMTHVKSGPLLLHQ